MAGALLAASATAGAFAAMERPGAPEQESTATSSDLYAYSLFGNNGAGVGMYKTSVAGDMEFMWERAEAGYHLYSGWMQDGKFCGVLFSGGGESGVRYQEYDLATGQVLYTNDVDPKNHMNWFIWATYIPETNELFGVGRDENNWSCIKKINTENLKDSENFGDVTIVKNINYTQYVVAVTYNPIDKNVYAVTTDKKLVIVDQNTGDYETVMDLPIRDLKSEYPQALVYLPTAGEFLFSAQFEDYTTEYYRIDAEAKLVFETAQLPNADCISCLISTDAGDMKAPSRPEYKGIDFKDGALEGTVSFILPNTLAGGEEATGTLTWKLLADSEQLATGEGKPGEAVDANVTMTQGSHILEMVAIQDGHESASTKVKVYIGNDVPLAPANVHLEEGKVTWDAVTEGENGGYLNLDDIYYEVYIEDEYVGETEGTTLEYTVDDDAEFMRHRAEVKAICSDLESASGYSNYCIYGAAMSLDVFFTPTEDEAGLFSTLSNGSEYGMKWGWSAWDSAFGTTLPQADEEAWFVSPPLRFVEKDAIYSLDFDAYVSSWSGGYTELSVYLGTSLQPEDMTTVLVEGYLPGMRFEPKQALFAVPESGIYYIGFLAKSADHSYQTYVKNIGVKKTDISTNAPVMCENLTAKAADKGELKAIVSFTMPAKNLIGGTYADDVEINANVVCGENTVSVKGAPGSEQTVEISTVQGNNTINVTCDVDGNAGSTADTVVFTGFDTAKAPANLKATVAADNRTVTLTWDAPEGGSSDGEKWFDPEDVTYTVGYSSWWSVTTIESGLTEKEFTYTFDDETLNARTLVVTADNKAGSGAKAEIQVVLGTPFTLPFSDDFATNKYIGPMFLETPSEAYESGYLMFQVPYNINEMFEKKEHCAVCVFSTNVGTQYTRLVFPKITTVGHEETGVYAHFEMWTGEMMSKLIRLYGRTYDLDEPVEIGTVEPGTGWANVEMAFPSELIGKDWVELYFETENEKADTYTMFYSYGFDTQTGVKSVSETDGSIRVNGRYVYINGMAGEEYGVYSLSGQVVKTGKVSSDQAAIGLEAGTYVVRCGAKTAKVFVK
jgi:hypothetical protein